VHAPSVLPQGHTGAVNSVAYSSDGTQLASGSDDNTVRIWDVASGECRATLEVGPCLAQRERDRESSSGARRMCRYQARVDARCSRGCVWCCSSRHGQQRHIVAKGTAGGQCARCWLDARRIRGPHTAQGGEKGGGAGCCGATRLAAPVAGPAVELGW
jgi:WD40 repeat protein